MSSPRWVTIMVAVILLTSGCLSGTGPASQGEARDGDGSGEPAPQLPGNLTLVDGQILERGQHQVTWRWSGTLDVGADALTREEPPQATTRLELPPDTWLRVNATLRYEGQATDLDLGITQGVLSLCLPNPVREMRAQAMAGDVAEDRESCEVRPDPTNAWTNWALTVSAAHWDPTPPEQAPFEVTVTVQALEASWSDVPTSWPHQEGWPSLEDAVIRPGSKIIQEGGCTANFVFESPANTSLYIGTAAHCLDGWGIGTLLGIAGIPHVGRLAYCSWGTIETNTIAGCPPPEESLADSLDNDFALVEIRPDVHHLAHPALLHWGGPTGIPGEVEQGTRVLMHGNSSLRDGFQGSVPGPADPIEGYLVHPGFNEWETYLNVDGGVPGDSGSPVVTETGLALGVVRSLEICDAGRPWTTISDLAPALAFLHDHTELEIELSTWPLIQESSLPASPVQDELSPLCGTMS